MAKQNKMTRQGVRDLDALYGKPKPAKIFDVPQNQLCDHSRTKRIGNGDTMCLACGTMWDWDGNEY
jgi:hypothetical protein